VKRIVVVWLLTVVAGIGAAQAMPDAGQYARSLGLREQWSGLTRDVAWPASWRSDGRFHYRKTVEIDPTFGTGQLFLAKALYDAGDLTGAEEWARKGLTNKPEPRMAPLGHYVLADVYERQGRAAEARREIEAADRLKRGSQAR